MTQPMTARTIVIGAGAAGLALGYRLKAAGEDFLILDADERVGDTWRQRYDSLRLFSLPKFASLPGWRMPASTFPNRIEMADYLEAYAKRFELPVRTGTRVLAVETDGAGFRIRTNHGELTARNVVVATGAHRRPKLPALSAQLAPGIRQLHSLEYRSPAQLAPGGVLVVGAANSGTDVALEAAAAGHPTWIAGRHPGQVPIDIDSPRGQRIVPVIMFVFRHVLTLRTPMGRKVRATSLGHGVNLVRNKLADLDAAGVTRIGRIEEVRDGRPVTTDGVAPDVANVVWCTGSDPDHAFLPADAFDTDGTARHRRGVSTVAGLYFLGLDFQFALASGTIQGFDRDARYLLRLMRRTGKRPAPAQAGDAGQTRTTGVTTLPVG
jgi:putative flavoprotein involved in K+ transport